jgi:hypothetical protein
MSTTGGTRHCELFSSSPKALERALEHALNSSRAGFGWRSDGRSDSLFDIWCQYDVMKEQLPGTSLPTTISTSDWEPLPATPPWDWRFLMLL